jgi:hypothetical protein
MMLLNTTFHSSTVCISSGSRAPGRCAAPVIISSCAVASHTPACREGQGNSEAHRTACHVAPGNDSTVASLFLFASISRSYLSHTIVIISSCAVASHTPVCRRGRATARHTGQHVMLNKRTPSSAACVRLSLSDASIRCADTLPPKAKKNRPDDCTAARDCGLCCL